MFAFQSFTPVSPKDDGEGGSPTAGPEEQKSSDPERDQLSQGSLARPRTCWIFKLDFRSNSRDINHFMNHSRQKIRMKGWWAASACGERTTVWSWTRYDSLIAIFCDQFYRLKFGKVIGYEFQLVVTSIGVRWCSEHQYSNQTNHKKPVHGQNESSEPQPATTLVVNFLEFFLDFKVGNINDASFLLKSPASSSFLLQSRPSFKINGFPIKKVARSQHTRDRGMTEIWPSRSNRNLPLFSRVWFRHFTSFSRFSATLFTHFVSK